MPVHPFIKHLQKRKTYADPSTTISKIHKVSPGRLGFPEISEIMTTSALTGEVAVITGISSGIGLAVARELHSYGMKLVLTARREDTLSRLKSELKAAVPSCVMENRVLAGAQPYEMFESFVKHFGVPKRDRC